jgi:tetratricopeptide (TPR) repeat protein
MFKQVPIQIWLLILIAVAAFFPARYVWMHVRSSPSQRDITQPPEDLSWRTSGQLTRNLLVLGALAAFAVFIFTPLANQIAQSPRLFPIIILAGGAWALATVALGFARGRIEPFVRGFYVEYERPSQPKRFWVSMAWNTLVGCSLFWIAFLSNEDAVMQPLEERCNDAKRILSPQVIISACDQLLGLSDTETEDQARWFSNRGSAYYMVADYGHAAADYIKSIHLNPGDSASHFNLGLVDERLGDRLGAVARYDAAIRADPEDADVYVNRGLIFLDGDKLDQAVADFTRAHELKPNDPTSIANRGIAYVWKKDWVRAERDFKAAQDLDPANAIASRGEAILSIDKGDLQNAAIRLTDALKSEPGDQWTLRKRAEVYELLGKLEESDADRDELWRLRADEKVDRR